MTHTPGPWEIESKEISTMRIECKASELHDRIDEAWEGGDTQETVHHPRTEAQRQAGIPIHPRAGNRGAPAAVPCQRVLPQPKAKKRCVGCGGPAEMNASLGPACPDCYDDLSG
jgi:hypothetical protein